MSLLRRRMMMAKEPDVPDTPTEELDYLTIIPLHEEEESYHISVCQGSLPMNPYSTQLAPLYYRINNGEWVEVMLPDLDIMYFYINLKKGDELQLKCTTYNLNVDDYDGFRYVSSLGNNNSAKFNVRGTPMSLIYGDYFKENNIVIEKAFYRLFYYSEGLTEILNPKTFLPYTVLESHCYDSMFYNCTNLVNAPELPATTLAESCYCDMFRGCTKLNYIKMLAIDISATDCLYCWTYRVSSTGTFVKNKDAVWDVRGEDGIPEGWTVITEEEEGESPYAFSFNMVTTDGIYEANSEELAILNKGLSIIIELAGGNLNSFEINQDTAPQEFDLRINGVRNFNFYFADWKDGITTCFMGFNDGVSAYYGNTDIQTSNPVFNSFILYHA